MYGPRLVGDGVWQVSMAKKETTTTRTTTTIAVSVVCLASLVRLFGNIRGVERPKWICTGIVHSLVLRGGKIMAINHNNQPSNKQEEPDETHT